MSSQCLASQQLGILENFYVSRVGYFLNLVPFHRLYVTGGSRASQGHVEDELRFKLHKLEIERELSTAKFVTKLSRLDVKEATDRAPPIPNRQISMQDQTADRNLNSWVLYTGRRVFVR